MERDWMVDACRSNNLSGIVNGIDYDEYNPETDPMLVHNYSPYNFQNREGV